MTHGSNVVIIEPSLGRDSHKISGLLCEENHDVDKLLISESESVRYKGYEMLPI